LRVLVPPATCPSDLASDRARALPAQPFLGEASEGASPAPSDETNDHVTVETL